MYKRDEPITQRAIDMLTAGQKFKFRKGGIIYIFDRKEFGQIAYHRSRDGKKFRKKFGRWKAVLIKW